MVSGEYFWLPHFYKDLNLLFTLTEACFHVSVLILAVLFYNFAFYDIFAFLQVLHCEMQHGPKCTSLQISLVKAKIYERDLQSCDQSGYSPFFWILNHVETDNGCSSAVKSAEKVAHSCTTFSCYLGMEIDAETQ